MRTCALCQVSYPDAVEFCPRDGARLPGSPPPEKAARADPLLGTTIDGRYIVESVLGQGGMGVVYAARHAIIDKRVAIKVLRAEHASSDSSASQRFLVEAKAASKIGHPNIVDITDFGVTAGGSAYFVMEFLDGPTLGRVVHKARQLPPERAIPIAIQIARGLQAAHDKQIIHRDLKPENVFVLERSGETRDFVKIVDFGIARDAAYKKRLTQSGMVLGTPEYMSPEQASGQATDHRVDMYALGCILYEMLTGEVPFRADTPTKTLTMHVFDKPTSPSERRPDLAIPSGLEALVMRALAKKPGDRFADLRAMIAALEAVLKPLVRSTTGASAPVSGSGGARPVSATLLALEAAVHGPRRRRLYAALGAASALVVALLGLVLSRSGSRATTPSAPASAAAAPPKAPAPVEISVTTTPAGAEVLAGAERMGASPLTFQRPASDEKLLLTIRHPGFREEQREVTPNVSKEIIVALVKQEPARRPVAAGHRPPRSPIQPQPAHSSKRVSDLRDPFAN